jgi:hypothetical protein
MSRFWSLMLVSAGALAFTGCYEYHVANGPAPIGSHVRVRFSHSRLLRVTLPRTTGEPRVLDLPNVVSLDGVAVRLEGQLLSVRVLAASDERGDLGELPSDVTLDVLLDSGTTVAVRRLSRSRSPAQIGLASVLLVVLLLATYTPPFSR